jgi:hypothetical protein
MLFSYELMFADSSGYLTFLFHSPILKQAHKLA